MGPLNEGVRPPSPDTHPDIGSFVVPAKSIRTVAIPTEPAEVDLQLPRRSGIPTVSSFPTDVSVNTQSGRPSRSTRINLTDRVTTQPEAAQPPATAGRTETPHTVSAAANREPTTPPAPSSASSEGTRTTATRRPSPLSSADGPTPGRRSTGITTEPETRRTTPPRVTDTRTAIAAPSTTATVDNPGKEPTATATVTTPQADPHPGKSAVEDGTASQLRTRNANPTAYSRVEKDINEGRYHTQVVDKPEIPRTTTVVREREPAPTEPVPVFDNDVRPGDMQPDAPNTPDKNIELEPHALARITRDEIKRRLGELKPGEEIKIALGPQIREFIATLPNNSQISKPPAPISIYNLNGDDIGRSWYADLSSKSKLILPIDQKNEENNVSPEVSVVQTPYKVTPELITEVERQLRLMHPNRPVSSKEVASMIGDLMHLMADSNWKKYMGEYYLTDFPLPSGRRPDIYNPVERLVGEFGTINHLKEKIIKVVTYTLELNRDFREGHIGKIFLYDHNAEEWRRRSGK